jgi:hypothetical protein
MLQTASASSYKIPIRGIFFGHRHIVLVRTVRMKGTQQKAHSILVNLFSPVLRSRSRKELHLLVGAEPEP